MLNQNWIAQNTTKRYLKWEFRSIFFFIFLCESKLFSSERCCTEPRFETKAQGNPQVAYSLPQSSGSSTNHDSNAKESVD